jgi:nucleotide-binding universal stress UspA family protein
MRMNTPMTWLLPVDGSPASLAAVRHALRIAGGAGGADAAAAAGATGAASGLGARHRFVLVNVQEPATLYEVVRTSDVQSLADLRREAGADLLREAEALLQAAGAEYECEVAGGAPERLIVELAENYGADAIVMGAHGQDTAPGHPSGFGPVARAVLESSPVPVTIVRAEEVTGGSEADAEAGGDGEQREG